MEVVQTVRWAFEIRRGRFAIEALGEIGREIGGDGVTQSPDVALDGPTEEETWSWILIRLVRANHAVLGVEPEEGGGLKGDWVEW